MIPLKIGRQSRTTQINKNDKENKKPKIMLTKLHHYLEDINIRWKKSSERLYFL